MKDKKYLYRCLLGTVIGVFASCSGDGELPAVSQPVTDAVTFTAGVRKNAIQTRAGEDEEIWLDMPYDQWMWNGTNTPIDFFIRQQVDGETNLAIYHLKQAETGLLEYVDSSRNPDEPLKWKSTNAVHNFHSWTEPAGVTMEASKESGTVDMRTKNMDYEYFVGETAGPMSYGTQGLTVGLRFEHLISKIVIDQISLIHSDGSVNANILSDKILRSIMFPNMPFMGTFTTGIKAGDEVMKVVHSDEDRGITYSDASHLQQVGDKKQLSFYLLPQAFNTIEEYGKFYVSLNHDKETGTIRLYEGNLNELVNEDDLEHNLTKIEAGECLTLRLVLKDDKVEGFYVHIVDWNTAPEGPVKDKPYPGIGSAVDIVTEGHFTDLGNNKFMLTDDFLKDLVYKEVDGKKVVRLCDNIDLSGFSDITLVIPDNYVLDGCNMNFICPGLQLEGEYKNVYINGTGPQSKP